MQFQAQTLVKKPDVATTQRESDDLDLFVGVKTSLNDPYNLFFRTSDISTQAQLIYFYAYSMGKKKIVMWGVYDRSTNEFLVDNSCLYHPNNLKAILDTWNTNAYDFISSSGKDNITSRMIKNNSFHQGEVKAAEGLYGDFKRYFMAKLTRDGLVPVSVSTDSSYRQLVQVDPEEFESIYDELLIKIRTVTPVNDRDERFQPFFEFFYSEIDDAATERLLRNTLDKNSASLVTIQYDNPYAFNIAKYIVVNYFILLFADFDDYRVCKLLVALMEPSEGDNKPKTALQTRLRTSVKGTFIYEWIIELIKVLRLSNGENFMTKYARQMVKLLEDRINLTTVGVIGARGPPLTTSLAAIVEFFEEFLSLSKYSKMSTVNDLKTCPLADECDLNDNQLCGLYNHGVGMPSKYDLS
jgi:hypothetical protein